MSASQVCCLLTVLVHKTSNKWRQLSIRLAFIFLFKSELWSSSDPVAQGTDNPWLSDISYGYYFILYSVHTDNSTEKLIICTFKTNSKCNNSRKLLHKMSRLFPENFAFEMNFSGFFLEPFIQFLECKGYRNMRVWYCATKTGRGIAFWSTGRTVRTTPWKKKDSAA